MDREARILHYITILLLIVSMGMCVYLNHQIDEVKHAVGVEESAFEEGLHEDLEQQEQSPRIEEKAETHID